MPRTVEQILADMEAARAAIKKVDQEVGAIKTAAWEKSRQLEAKIQELYKAERGAICDELRRAELLHATSRPERLALHTLAEELKWAQMAPGTRVLYSYSDGWVTRTTPATVVQTTDKSVQINLGGIRQELKWVKISKLTPIKETK